MKQYQAVISTLERLGGISTLARLNQEVFKIKDCEWNTKTPFASIRRIVQERPEIFRVRPGLWALESFRYKLEAEGIIPQERVGGGAEDTVFSHGYYQGLLIEIGRLRDMETYVPAQDRHRKCLGRDLCDMVSLSRVPQFTYQKLVHKIGSVDVLWFQHNSLDPELLMPKALFEVEHTTDIQNSLLKFQELRWFFVNMFIVADNKRRNEFAEKMKYSAFSELRNNKRVEFVSYDQLVSQYNLVSAQPSVSLLL